MAWALNMSWGGCTIEVETWKALPAVSMRVMAPCALGLGCRSMLPLPGRMATAACTAPSGLITVKLVVLACTDTAWTSQYSINVDD